MDIRQKRSKRKAISPVLATVILIAITLIAAIAIAGFVFGLFGTFTSTARISATTVACAHTGAGPGATVTDAYCQITLTNSGNSPGTAQTCAFTGSNGAGAGILSATSTAATAATFTVTTTGPQTAYCVAGAGTVAGTMATGTVSLSNGGSALFAGTFA